MQIPVAIALRNLIDNHFMNWVITLLPGILLFFEVDYVPFVLILICVYWIQQIAFTASPSATLFIRVMESNTVFNIAWVISALLLHPNWTGGLYALTLLILPIGSMFINPIGWFYALCH